VADPDAGSADDVELGVVAPAALGPFGCAVLHEDDLVVSPMKGGMLEKLTREVKSSRAPWPSVVEGAPARVYWVSSGRLVRRKVSSDGVVGPLEVLASDAAEYSQTAAVHLGEQPGLDAVAYIGRTVSKELERSARVWLEGKGSRVLSADGAGATSVAAVSMGPRKAVMLTIDGRLALSPIHARRLELGSDGEARLADDHVIFVAGPSEGRIDLAAVQVGSTPMAFTAISRDTTTFGMLSLAVPPAEGEAEAQWYMYPNGLTPAPLAAASLCGKPALAWVQPEDARAGARKAIVVALVEPDGRVREPAPVAWADKVKHLALRAIEPVVQAPGKDGKPRASLGAVLAYATESSLRSRPIACR
jgi:hypothetical protein